MTYHYDVYGLSLQSNQVLKGLAPATSPHITDVRFDVDLRPIAPLFFAISQDCRLIPDGFSPEGGRYWLLPDAAGAPLRLCYRGAAKQSLNFLIHPQGDHIECHCSEPDQLENITTLLIGTVLNCVLRLRGRLCLHACVVNIGSRAIAILGDRGAGKSTTAATFAQNGFPIVSDDIAALTMGEEGWLVHPGYPRLRLWTATLEALNVPVDGLKPVLNSSGKFFLELSSEEDAKAWRFQRTVLPLGAIYLLSRDASLETPVIESLEGIECLTTLLAHTHSHFAPLDKQNQAREFAGLSRLASSVSLRHVRCPNELERLPTLRDALVHDVQSAKI